MLNLPSNLQENRFDNEMEDEAVEHCEDSELVNNGEDEDLNNFKGVYFNDETEEKYYEGGAHFKYSDLYRRLENVYCEISSDRRGDIDVYYDQPKTCGRNYLSDDEDVEEVANIKGLNREIEEKPIVKPIIPSMPHINTTQSKNQKNGAVQPSAQSNHPSNSHSHSVNLNAAIANSAKANMTSKNILKEINIKSLRVRESTVKNLQIGIFGGSTNIGSGSNSSKNAFKKESIFMIKDKEKGKEMKDDKKLENNQPTQIYKKIKPQTVLANNNHAGINVNNQFSSSQTKSRQKILNSGAGLKIIKEKKINTTKVQKSKININSTLNNILKSQNMVILNSSTNKSKIPQQANSISKTTSIINELNKISTITKSRNMSKVKKSGVVGTTHNNATGQIFSPTNNKLTYSDSKTQHFAKDKGNSGRIIASPQDQANNTCLNNIPNNSSSHLLNSFNLNFKTITNNKSRNTQRNLPDKTDMSKSKNHTTTDNKTVYINTHESLVGPGNKFLSSTMKNELNMNSLGNLTNFNNFNNLIFNKDNTSKGINVNVNLNVNVNNINNEININKRQNVNQNMEKEKDLKSKDLKEDKLCKHNDHTNFTPSKPKIINDGKSNFGNPHPNSHSTLNNMQTIKNMPQFLIKNVTKKSQAKEGANTGVHNKRVLLNYKEFNKFMNSKKETKSNSKTLKFLLLNNQTNKKELSLSKDGNNSNSNNLFLRENTGNSYSREKILHAHSQNYQIITANKSSLTGTGTNTNQHTNTNIYNNSSANDSRSVPMNPNNSKNTNVNSYYNTNNNSNNLINFNNNSSLSNNSSNIVIPNKDSPNVNNPSSIKANKYKILYNSTANKK